MPSSSAVRSTVGPPAARALAALAVPVALGVTTGAALGQAELIDGRTVIRDENQVAIIRGLHPRAEGRWYQYGGETALRKNVVITDVLTPDSVWENFRGEPVPTHAPGSELEQYSRHNHYQNLLSEVWNFVPNANAVAMWGDSMAITSGAKAWGGFFSARSWCKSFVDGTFERFKPAGLDVGCGPEYDCQLIGLEVDVLNSGKPGVWPNMAKCGIEIVGFGNPNSMAVEVRCEDTDADRADRRGRWNTGVYFKNCMTDDGRLVVADFDRAAIGLDFRGALFSQGAVAMRTEGLGTGIVCNGGRSGEIHGGRRWPSVSDETQWLTLRTGDGGLRIASHDTTRELLAVDNHGGIYLNGDLFLNNRRVEVPGLAPAGWRIAFNDRTWLAVVAVLCLAILWLTQKVIRLQVRLGRFIRSAEQSLKKLGVPAA